MNEKDVKWFNPRVAHSAILEDIPLHGLITLHRWINGFITYLQKLEQHEYSRPYNGGTSFTATDLYTYHYTAKAMSWSLSGHVTRYTNQRYGYNKEADLNKRHFYLAISKCCRNYYKCTLHDRQMSGGLPACLDLTIKLQALILKELDKVE